MMVKVGTLESDLKPVFSCYERGVQTEHLVDVRCCQCDNKFLMERERFKHLSSVPLSALCPFCNGRYYD